ncbi:MAG: D-alanine--D-alanine ligase family protein [Anaerolineales bacterium]|jgi:D-alanine-D-alanine ligase
MGNKLRIAVLFGGRSGEHEVSLMSARSVLSALDPEKYEITQIGITKEGVWLTGENILEALSKNQTEDNNLNQVIIIPDQYHNHIWEIQNKKSPWNLTLKADVDVVFPVLHGTFGEDGTLQGLLELADLAYVGAGVTGSAVGMDKGIFKDVMRANNIPTAASVIVLRSEIEKNIQNVIQKAETVAPYPLFVKPANLGSSVGISKCTSKSDLGEGLLEAAMYDRRVLVERGVNAREIEVSVLGNDIPMVSVPGEVLPSREFYSYESKYIDGTSGLVIPATLPPVIAENIRQMAVTAYKATDCAGMARVDFFVEKGTDEIYLNELNTIPGFTSISMYPKLWEASGISYPKLVDRLVELAIERKTDRDHTERNFRRIS